MPTFDRLARFRRDFKGLTPEQQRLFLAAVRRFVEDLRSRHFRPGLRVKTVRGLSGVYELTWAPDGRATFAFGPPIRAGDPHVIWRRVGTHEIFREP